MVKVFKRQRPPGRRRAAARQIREKNIISICYNLKAMAKTSGEACAPAASGGTGRERVFLALGSNVGRRPDNLRKALRLLRQLPGTRVVRVSRLYTTSPVGYTDQRDFLNGVVELRTRLAPDDLMERTREIEAELGKATPFRDGPRAIDIDLALYGSRVVDTRSLVVPHPRLHRRRFVLEPLAEVAPGVVHPVAGRSASRLLAGLGREERVRPWGDWEPVSRRAGGTGTR